MKNVVSVLFFSIACSSNLFGQSLIDGFIVKTSGDTVRGFIRDRFEWSKVHFIEVSSTEKGKVEKIPMAQVDNFFLKKYDSYLFRRVLDIDKKPVEISRLEEVPDQRIVKDTIVLRLILKGELNLYDYVDEYSKKHFFIQRNGEKIEELGFVKYYDNGISTNVLNSGTVNQVQVGRIIMEQALFVETLKQYFLVNCTSVKIISPVYEEEPLKAMIRTYNSCFPQGTREFGFMQQGKGSLSIDVFAGGGVAFANYKGNAQQNNSSTPDPNKADFGSTSAIVAGINLDFIAGRKSRFIPGVQLGYVKTGTATSETKLVTKRQSLWVNFSMATAGARIKYIFVEKNYTNLYGVATGGVQKIISSTSKYTSTDLSLNTTTEGDFTKYKSLGYFYSLVVGSQYNRLFAEIGYRPIICPEVTRQAPVPGNPTTKGRAVLSLIDITVGFSLTKN